MRTIILLLIAALFTGCAAKKMSFNKCPKVFYRALILLLFPFLGYSQTKVIAPIEPNNLSDTYPTHSAQYGKGGLVSVATWQLRNAITTDRREVGMVVRVTGVDSTYTLVGGILNSNWQPFATTPTGVFVDLSNTQTIGGVKTFSSDIVVNTVNVGKGPGSYFGNTRFGTDALASVASGGNAINTAVGHNALRYVASFGNVGVGYQSLMGQSGATTGDSNTGVGQNSLQIVTTGSGNAIFGSGSGRNITTGAEG